MGLVACGVWDLREDDRFSLQVGAKCGLSGTLSSVQLRSWSEVGEGREDLRGPNLGWVGVREGKLYEALPSLRGLRCQGFKPSDELVW